MDFRSLPKEIHNNDVSHVLLKEYMLIPDTIREDSGDGSSSNKIMSTSFLCISREETPTLFFLTRNAKEVIRKYNCYVIPLNNHRPA